MTSGVTGVIIDRKPCFSVGVSTTKSKKSGGLVSGSLNRYQVNSINNSFSKLNTTKVKGPSASTKNLRKSSSKTRKKQ